MLDELPTRAEREPVVGQGLGGDDTTAIDKAAEDAILARFRAIDGITIVSEEVGRLGDGSTVVVDRPDRRLAECEARHPVLLSIYCSRRRRATMGDVHFGYVYDFGTGEEWVARRGEGATLNGEPLTVRPKDTIEILRFEATLTSLDRARCAEGRRARVPAADHGLARALALPSRRRPRRCGVLAERRALGRHRAAQLLVREAGLAIELFDDPRSFAEAELDLEGRSRVAAAGTPALCRQLAAALSG